jgi:hypothetical protein
MKLVISLFVLNLIGCATGIAPRSTAVSPAVQDGNNGGATTDSGNATSGTPKPPPHPNV